MNFDPNNNVIKLCAEGMEAEMQGNADKAGELFAQAWDEAGTDFERFTAAHYLARQQGSIAAKLDWDLRALGYALAIEDLSIKGSLPSLYLNIAKGYEDLNDTAEAKRHYELALAYVPFLPDNEYGKMIGGGVYAGMGRVGI